MKQPRRTSFSSSFIMDGCMPDYVGLDNPTINIIFTFDSAPDVKELVSSVQTFFQYRRLSTVPNGNKSRKKWTFENIGDIDPRKMVRLINISCDTKEEWTNIVQQQRDVNLRRNDLPWWEFVLMINEGKEDHILLFRIDHGIADGLSLANIFPCILKKLDGSGVSTLIPPSMISNKERAEKNILKIILKMPGAIYQVLSSPFGRYDDPTSFSKNVVGKHVIDNRNQKLVVFDPIPLDFVKEIKDSAGVSLNDVLLTAWTHAIYEYCHLQECLVVKGKKTNDILFRALMTVGFPHKKSSDSAEVMQNSCPTSYGCILRVPLDMSLPVGIKSVKQKLKSINKSTKSLKSSPLALVQLFLQNVVMRLLPRFVSRWMTFSVYSKRSLTFTNVPGPNEQVILAGEELKSCRFFVNHLHPVVSILSYHGQINISLAVDEEQIPNIHLLAPCFMKALVLLSNELNVKNLPSSVLETSKLIDMKT